jgi:hypothetical protein
MKNSRKIEREEDDREENMRRTRRGQEKDKKKIKGARGLGEDNKRKGRTRKGQEDMRT